MKNMQVSTWESELKKGIPADVISGERLPVQINGKCSCYLPWEDRTEETTVKDFFCTLPDFKLHLAGIEPEGKYAVTFFDGEKRIISGFELAKLEIHLDNPRSFRIFMYEDARDVSIFSEKARKISVFAKK